MPLADKKKNKDMILAAKSAPCENILLQICEAGLKAAEVYLSQEYLKNIQKIAQICKKFPLRYSLHAPNEGFAIEELAQLSEAICAEVVVFHNNYWDDEWNYVVERLRNTGARLCIENTRSFHEAIKFMRRYGMGRCLDLEHMQMEGLGVYESVFVEALRQASHVHITGYQYGSSLWHTHLHHSPEHGRYLLGLLKKADYKGFLVSEADVRFQSREEFSRLRLFFESWQDNLNSVAVKNLPKKGGLK